MNFGTRLWTGSIPRKNRLFHRRRMPTIRYFARHQNMSRFHYPVTGVMKYWRDIYHILELIYKALSIVGTMAEQSWNLHVECHYFTSNTLKELASVSYTHLRAHETDSY